MTPLTALNTLPAAVIVPSQVGVREDLRPTHGHAGSSRLLTVDKSLPPIPRPGSVSFDLPARDPTGRPSIHRSASALAFNSQHLAAPHGNLTSYLPTYTPDSPKPLPLQPFPDSEGDAHMQAPDNSRRRSRGLSLGPLSFFTMTTSEQKPNGKDTSRESLPKRPSTAHSSPKPISRKSSFWRKNKDTASPDDLPQQSKALSVEPSPHLPPQLPPLSNLSSTAPFGLEDFARGIASSFSSKAARRLSSRRHSIESLSQQSRPPSPSQPPSDSSAPSKPTSHPPPTSRSISSPVTSADTVAFPRTDAEQTLVPSLSMFAKRRRAQTNPSLASSDPALPRLTIDVPPNMHQHTPSLPSNRPEAPPKPNTDEAPHLYLNRIRAVVGKGDLATALASSPQPIYLEALRIFMSEFEFENEPLDIALRKLLMEVGLPRETQQIDRVVEAFSFRYSTCNPGLFSSEDHAYILAFSLIMLHTDAFNRSNKTKMTKADYVKNASLPGIYPEILGCFFDNVTFSPFIFIEDPLDAQNHGGQSPDTSKRLRTPLTPSPAGMLNRPKVDPYYLITNNLLESMKGDVEKLIPVETPFRSQGNGQRINDRELQAIFSNARLLQVEVPEKRPLFAMGVSGNVVPRSSGDSNKGNNAPPESPSRNILTLKTVKIGVLNRKNDITGRGKRSAVRKWRAWTVLLTTSQIMFFRDIDMKDQLPGLIEASSEKGVCGSIFKPDDIMPLKDAIALFDSSYVKHENTFRLVLSSGRQILLKASDMSDADHWLSCINYASTFKSAGIRPRPIGMSQHDVRLTGVAAATSHLHDLQSQALAQPLPSQWDTSTPSQLMGMLSGTFNQRPPLKHRLNVPSEDLLDLDTISSLQSAGSEQFQMTFNQVKADLAVGSPVNGENASYRSCESQGSPPFIPNPSSMRSRQDLVRQRLWEFEWELALVHSELMSETRFLRNIAILRPLQTATRTKLVTAVQSFAAPRKLTTLRIQYQRLACYATVLRHDLEADIDSLASMKHIALDAAKRSLELRQADAIPRMTISTHEPEEEPPHSAHTLARTGSSTSLADSFYSAVDYSSDWPLDEYEATTSISRSPSQAFDSPRPSTSSSIPHSGLYPTDLRSPKPLLVGRSSSALSSEGGSHKDLAKPVGQEAEAEEAEPWNRTRAAKRVSLIRVPSSVAFTKRTPNRNLATTSTHLDT
ncbi:ARF guanyl-nucleotide exchange factor [Coprinopsis sp. MPI-PUGE-AT-0042]|nr:ARF guanyl-nucleotide exchange factor [Coprinopsis sp. MPI-PUGE-AT-0042]